jgi:hypothetical protein
MFQHQAKLNGANLKKKTPTNNVQKWILPKVSGYWNPVILPIQ